MGLNHAPSKRPIYLGTSECDLIWGREGLCGCNSLRKVVLDLGRAQNPMPCVLIRRPCEDTGHTDKIAVMGL